MPVTISGDGLIEGISVDKKIAAFTASGTWTVPAGVTYAIAHMVGGGGGVGFTTTAGAGGDSSVAFASGTVTAGGGAKGNGSVALTAVSAAANSGHGANGVYAVTSSGNNVYQQAQSGARIVAGAAVTPAASITVTVGAGGTQGSLDSGTGVGGSGYVYIEYYD